MTASVPSLEDLLVAALDRGARQVEIRAERAPMARLDGRLVALAAPIASDAVKEMARRVDWNADRNRAGVSRTWVTPAGATIPVAFAVHTRPDDALYRSVAITAILQEDPVAPPLASHDLPEAVTERLRPGGGLALVCGGPGSGRDGLLDAIAAELVRPAEAGIVVARVAAYAHPGLGRLAGPTTLMSQVAYASHQAPLPELDALIARLATEAGTGVPDVLVVDEVPGRLTLGTLATLARRGTLVVAGLTAPDVPAALRWLASRLPVDGDQGLAHDVVESLALVLAQRMLPGTGIDRVACHSWLTPTSEERRFWHRTRPWEWEQAATAALASGQVGTSFSENAVQLYQQGRITRETYRDVTG